MQTRVFPFTDEYASYVRTLNEEWLTAFFRLEPCDVVQLANPKATIIDRGGYIYLAESEGQICGVAALMRINEHLFELSKMAVTASFQGRGIGRMLAITCIEKAKTIGIPSLVLYSNRKLQAAIHLYESLGFYEIALESGCYERADIKMQLDLTDNPQRT
jgi:ribosomal protein S18 acetylase RimI-like enzyme